MIYWHVERKSLCIHSQLKSPSSSEVAAMIEGVIRHCTEMSIDRQYIDSHGQSEVAFAFCFWDLGIGEQGGWTSRCGDHLSGRNLPAP